METTITKTIDGILALLSKNILNNSNDANICAIAQKWIDLFNKLDRTTRFTFHQPEDERRLWFILESQKDEIITKLSQLGIVGDTPAETPLDADQTDQLDDPDDFAQSQSEDDFNNEERNIAEDDLNNTDNVLVTATPSQSESNLRALQQVEETILPVQQPVLAPIETTQEFVSAPAPIETTQEFVSAPAPIKTTQEFASVPQHVTAPTSIPNFFTESQDLAAAAFHDKLCNSLEKAFQATNMLSVTHFDAVTAQMKAIEQIFFKELAEFESRLNMKLEAIHKTSSISANNTDAMSKMFSSYALENNHSY